MLSHIVYPKLDPRWPASLSTQIAKDLLRNHLGFNGLVLTDDLDMGAIAKHTDIRTAIGRVLAADIDMALICHQGPAIENAADEILREITDSSEIKTRAIESAGKILRMKKKYLQLRQT